MQHDVILVRYGELSLKSRYVRKQFETQLVQNIKTACKKSNIICTVNHDQGRIYLKTSEISKAAKILPQIFGIVSYSPAITTSADLPTLKKNIIPFSKPLLSQKISFALRITRTGNHPYTSQQAAQQLGEHIQQHTRAPVDLTNPDQEIFIEIRNKHAYLFTTKEKGPGGLPYGTQGTLLAFITDPQSLLAAWYLMRRGCKIHFAMLKTDSPQYIKEFTSKWNIPAEITSIDETATIKTLITKHNSIGLITSHTLTEKPETALSELNNLKQTLNVPILTPLIAMTKQEIDNKMQEVGLNQ